MFCFACGMRCWSVVRCLYNNTATQTRRRNLTLALAQGGGGGGCAHDRAKEARKGKGSWEGKGSGRKAVCMCGIIRRWSPPSLSALSSHHQWTVLMPRHITGAPTSLHDTTHTPRLASAAALQRRLQIRQGCLDCGSVVRAELVFVCSANPF